MHRNNAHKESSKIVAAGQIRKVFEMLMHNYLKYNNMSFIKQLQAAGSSGCFDRQASIYFGILNNLEVRNANGSNFLTAPTGRRLRDSDLPPTRTRVPSLWPRKSARGGTYSQSPNGHRASLARGSWGDEVLELEAIIASSDLEFLEPRVTSTESPRVSPRDSPRP